MEECPRATSFTHTRSPPLQARAVQFFKKWNLRGRFVSKKSKDDRDIPSPLQEPHYARQTRSMDILTKPPTRLSHTVVGLRLKAPCNQVDTDDSSQPPSSSNSPLRSRNHAPWDSEGRPATSLGFHSQSASEVSPNILVQGNCVKEAEASTGNSDGPNSANQSEKPRERVAPIEEAYLQTGLLEPPKEGNVSKQSEEPSETHAPSINEQPVLSDHAESTAASSQHSTEPTFASQSGSPESHSGDIHSRRIPGPPLRTEIPPAFQIGPDHGLRFSPPILTRYTPMLRSNLPTLLLPNPTAQPATVQPRSRLRSMPSLSLHGVARVEADSDHESVSDESEEGEGGGVVDNGNIIGNEQSDEEGDDKLPTPISTQSLTRNPSVLSRLDTSLKGPSSVGSPTPIAGPSRAVVSANGQDYFSPKDPAEITSPTYTPRDRKPSLRPQFVPMLSQAMFLSGLHHSIASRSMTDLMPSKEAGEQQALPKGKARDTLKLTAVAAIPVSHTPSGSTAGDDILGIGHALRRQNSLPSYNPSSVPPPYPMFTLRKKSYSIQPREEEGIERLPCYSNSVYLTAVMPRKMEFAAPGVQAKDRKWRRVICELDGTVLRVYKCPAGASGVGVIGEWWEKKVGVGNITASMGSNAMPMRKDEPEHHVKGADAPSSSASGSNSPVIDRERRRSQSPRSSLNSSFNSSRPKRSSFLGPLRTGGSPLTPSRSGLQEAPPINDSQSSFTLSRPASHTDIRMNNANRPSPRFLGMRSSPPTTNSFPSRSALHSRLYSGEVQKPDRSDLIRAYTLQHAESGLGNDYQKRKNVIRVRMEGEQFLLQAQDVPAVVEWIEGLHAGTNISLDLDERVMPKGPIFPRRRRRRSRRIVDGDQSDQTHQRDEQTSS